MSPALEEKLAFTVTLAGSYADAALLAGKWGSEVDDSVIHTLVQRLGSQAEAQTQGRLGQAPRESQPQRRASELAILMMDGWLVRFRGPGWGKQKTKKDRVEWHELKTGVFYLQEQAGETAGGRGVIAQKRMVRWQGEPVEFGRRLSWEALRGGLGRAEEVLILGDGGPWIWNLAQDRWQEARQLLDFYHGGEHLWELGRACAGGRETKSQALGGTTTPPTASWAGTRGFAGDWQSQSRARSNGPNNQKATELFRGPSRSHELQGDSGSGLAHWQWSGRIGLPPKPMPV
jgi:hypothetical protein